MTIKAGSLLFAACAVALSVLAGIRSWLVPFSHDEVATFYFYVHQGDFFPFTSHIDANGHFLTSALGWICFKLFGPSPFSLRLPSLIALFLLIYGVSRYRRFFRSAVLFASFALSILGIYTFIAYFSMCRGYGISMACLLMAVCYLFLFMQQGRQRHFAKFLLFMQLALAANLTLIFLALFCTAVAFCFHVASRRLWRFSVVTLYLLNLGLIFFWVKYAFFLRDNGALYYGAGDSYWEVTFVTLIRSLFGDHAFLPAVILILSVLVAVLWLARVIRFRFAFLVNPAGIAPVLLGGLIITFYFLKKVANVNYPEDRTGLFFYPLFAIAFFTTLDEWLPSRWSFVSLLPALAGVITAGQFISLKNHPWSNYETMPAAFYDILVEEEKKTGRRITIGGHRIREFIYGFQNYRSDYKLNHMTSPEALHMNCDYALAVAKDEPWFSKYYSVIAAEDSWGFRLLKRKQPIERRLVWETTDSTLLDSDGEYHNFFEVSDTIFSVTDPVQAEITFRVEKAEKPLHGWFVFQIDATPPEDNIFVRVPLDLVAYDWVGEGVFTMNLPTGKVPSNAKRMVLYFWNIDKKPVRMSISNCRLVQLHAPGISEISDAKL